MSFEAAGGVTSTSSRFTTRPSFDPSVTSTAESSDLQSRLRQIEIMVETLDSPEVKGELVETLA